MVKTRSLYLSWAWIDTGSWRTDRRTDRIMIASTRWALRGVTRKNAQKLAFFLKIPGNSAANLEKQTTPVR